MKIIIWNAAKGGMRSVVEAYARDGFTERHNVKLIASYADGGFIARQLIFLKGLFEFLFCLCRTRVSLVHIHVAMRGSFWRKNLFASLGRAFGCPIILHLHGSEMEKFYEAQPKILRWLIRRNLSKATRVVVLSESWRHFIKGVAPRATAVVIPNYVRVPDLQSLPAAKGRDILFLGFIGPRKGAFDLVECFKQLSDRFSELRLTLAGNGDVERARQRVDELGLTAVVEIPGWINEMQREQLLLASGIYVLPSYNEGLPMSVLEAMAHGLAVVTTNVGGIPELITHELDGLLVAPGDKQAITDAIARLVSDDRFRESIAVAGRRRVAEQYSDVRVLSLLDAIYLECERSSY